MSEMNNTPTGRDFDNTAAALDPHCEDTLPAHIKEAFQANLTEVLEDPEKLVTQIAKTGFRIMRERDAAWERIAELEREKAMADLVASAPPSVLYRPRLFKDGSMWCALYGEDLQTGVTGFGKSPAEAMTAFDEAWVQEVQQ